MKLPRWKPSMSDGCSNAPLLSAIPGARKCCERHDEAYYYGGSAADRKRADDKFKQCLIAASKLPENKGKLPRWRIEFDYSVVRMMGGPGGRDPKYSWAYGGKVFKYTERPAEPID